jgi:hypothetical protein
MDAAPASCPTGGHADDATDFQSSLLKYPEGKSSLPVTAGNALCGLLKSVAAAVKDRGAPSRNANGPAHGRSSMREGCTGSKPYRGMFCFDFDLRHRSLGFSILCLLRSSLHLQLLALYRLLQA